MPTTAKTSTCALLLALATALPAAAKDEPEVRLNAFKVVPPAPGAPERLVPLQAMRPGDTVEYEAVYRNPTAQLAKNVALTLPVPPGGLTYQPMPALAPLANLASTDGKVFEAVPLMRTLTTADGRRVTQPVPLAEYRYLRWTLGDLPAGSTRSVRARMHLVGAEATTVASASPQPSR
jgi:uncharacterized repeat protein (TIGR01451 family)